MYILKYFNQTHHLHEKPIKGPNWIVGAEIIDGKGEPLEYQGISDFSGFSLTDEDGAEVPFDEELSPSLNNEYLLESIIDLDFRQTMSELGL